MLKDTKEIWQILLLMAVAGMLVLSLEYLGLFSGIDTYFYDTLLRLRGEMPASGRVVIVAVDSKALGVFGKWPLRRRHYAEMLDRLGQAAVVGFDLLLMDPTEDDGLLEASIKKHGRVVVPEYVNSSLSITRPFGQFSPLMTGHVHIELGIDNTAREVYHSLYCRDTLLPSLASVIYERASGNRIFRMPPPLNHADTSGAGRLFQQDVQKINYYGPPGKFRQISLADVVAGAVPKDFFRDKIVLVGLTIPGIGDQVSIPLSQSRTRMPGVEVHASIVNNLLDNSYIRDVPGWVRTASVCIASLVLGMLLVRMSERKAALLWCFSLFLFTTVTALLLYARNLWLPLSVYYASFTLVYVISYSYRLDKAARKLDREHEAMISLLECDAAGVPAQTHAKGLFGILSEEGLNGKIQRQISMTTKLVELNRHLEDSLKLQREALDNQVRLVEMLSHEYRTPLAIIRANLDILEMKDVAAGGVLSGNFSKMKRAVSRLVEVMNISLRRERLQDTHAKIDLNEIRLLPFMRSTMMEACELWSERRLELEIKDNGDYIVVGDSRLLKTALLNLIDNAVKYSAENMPVLVSIAVTEEEAVIRVRNHGAVISAAELKMVFEKYYRGAASCNTRGAGLGLYLVRRIIEQQHGSVTLASNEADETVAVVRLPLR